MYYIFAEEILYCTDTLILYMNLPTSIFLIQFLRDFSIIITITNISIRTKLHPKSYVFVSEAITKQTSNNRGHPSVASNIRIML